ncbi:MAG: DUF6095 family protein [Lutimonas sp.]
MSKSKKLKSNPLLMKGFKYLAIALPLLFLSPVIVTMGFKLINKNGSFLLLILGIILTIFTILLVTQGIRIILKALFDHGS